MYKNAESPSGNGVTYKSMVGVVVTILMFLLGAYLTLLTKRIDEIAQTNREINVAHIDGFGRLQAVETRSDLFEKRFDRVDNKLDTLTATVLKVIQP